MMSTHWIVVIMSVMFLKAAQEFGDTAKMTISHKLVILPKRVYYRNTHKNTKKKINLCQDQQMYYLLFLSEQAILQNIDQFFSRIYNNVQNHSYEEVDEDQYVFRRYFRVRQEVNDEIKTIICFIKDELQISIENNTYDKTRRGNHFGCMVMYWGNCPLRILRKHR